MKRKHYSILVLVICFFTLGMGNTGSGSLSEIPVPEKNFKASLVDQTDVSFKLEGFSFEGETNLEGMLGRADIVIGFEKIDSILFVLKEKDLIAKIKLKDKKILEIIVNKNSAFFGKTSFGNLRIELGDVKMVSLP